MTGEAKQNLLEYMLGKLPNESGIDTIIAPTVTQINNNLDAFVRQYYSNLSSFWSVEQLIARGDYIILWCSDYENDFDSPYYGQWKKSFVIVLDKNYNPLKYVDKYASGTPLNPLVKLNANDDGTGKIYGIDLIFKSDLTTVDRRRVVIINDFTLTNFEIRLLNSYDIPQYNGNLLSIEHFVKSNTESKYFIVYHYMVRNTGTGKSVSYGGGLEFVNNVGSENKWNFYPYVGSKNIEWNGFNRGFPNWGNEKLEFKIFSSYKTDLYNNNSIAMAVLNSHVDGETTNCIDGISANLPDECQWISQIGSSVSLNEDILVETISTGDVTTKYVIEYSLNDLSYKVRYSKDDYIFSNTSLGYIQSYDEINLFSINNKFYFLRHYQYYEADRTNYTYNYFDNKLYLEQIYDDNVIEFFIKDFEQQSDTNYSLFISNVFNLYEFGLIFPNFILKLSQIYNSVNYNGKSFTDKNSLIPNSAILYSNGSPVFARNLYNKTLNGATTTSTIEIPNNYLNDTLVDKSNLLSKNNNVIINYNNSFDKNIYETVYLNFVNTISVINQNETLPVYNNGVATKLNTSINNPTDYDDLKLTKFRINYQDGTNVISNLQAKLSEDGSYQLLMTFYLSKSADTLELISENEETVYLTYSLSNEEANKYYSFKQRVRIGGNEWQK